MGTGRQRRRVVNRARTDGVPITAGIYPYPNVRDRKLFPVEEAVRKMSSLAAVSKPSG